MSTVSYGSNDLSATTSVPNYSLPVNAETVRFGPFVLTPSRRELSENGVVLRIGGRAMDILLYLIAHAGETIDKESLISVVWPNSVIDEGTLRVQIASLRKVLGDGINGRRYITNIPQRGYCFTAPLSDVKAGTKVDTTQTTELSPGSATGLITSRVTRLIGRDAVVQSTSDLLSSRRFVTLAGPGGVGKTSVALAVVQSRHDEYAHGSHLVDLDTTSNASLVPSAIASTLGLSILSDDPTPHIITFLKDKQLVLLLDNCEHVVDSVAQIAEEIFRHAPNVEILATSREPLQARGEWVQRLMSLDTPSPDMLLTADEALTYPAIDLFVERTRAGMDSFIFKDENVIHVVQICHRLDGLPLAIEFVARRVGLFGLRTLADTLDEKLSFLTQGHRTALPRQKTLYATLDWSYGLLTTTEQALLCCLSVFRESFSLNSAIHIASGIGIETIDATESMASLVDKSLVVVIQGKNDVNYRLLNTTRNYAALKLNELPFEADARRRHALLMSDILIAADRELHTARKSLTDWCAENSRRIDDIRTALNWAFSDTGDKLIGVDLVLASAPLWFQFMLLNEYVGWLNATLALGPENFQGPYRHIRLTLALGNAYLYTQGPKPETFSLLKETLRLAHELRDRESELRAMWALYYCNNMIGEYRNSLELAKKFGVLAQESNDRIAELTYHRLIGLVHHLNGDHQLAKHHVMQALIPPSEISAILHGSAYQIDHQTACLTQLARILWIQGFPEQSFQTIAKAVERAQIIKHAFSLAFALALAACPIAFWAGDIDIAAAYVMKLQKCTEEHSLQYWRGWTNVHVQTLEFKKNVGVTPDHLRASLFDDALVGEGLVDTVATMGSWFVGRKAIARIEEGKNGWSAAEVYRVLGERALSCDAPDEVKAEGLFNRSRDLAREQGANFWLLRTASSLARLYQSQGRLQEAKDILADALAEYNSGDSIADVRHARAFLYKLNT